MNDLVNSVECAKILTKKLNRSIKREFISRLAKENKIPFYDIDGKKLYRPNEIINNLPKSRTTSIQDNIKNNNDIDTLTDDSIKENTELYNGDTIQDLEAYLQTAINSSQKVQIIKDYWTGKINEQKYLTEQGTLISINNVVSENQKVVKAIRDKCLAIPSKVAPIVVGIDNIVEIQQILDDAIYEALS